MAPRKINKTNQRITLTVLQGLVITKGYGVPETTIEGQNALLNALLGIDFARHTVFHPQFYTKSGKRTPVYLYPSTLYVCWGVFEVISRKFRLAQSPLYGISGIRELNVLFIVRERL